MDWSVISNELRRLADRHMRNCSVDYIIFRLDQLRNGVIELHETVGMAGMDPDVTLNLLDEAQQELSLELVQSGPDGVTGRPAIEIPLEVLESYISAGLSVRHTAELLNVSERTVFRRIAEHGLRLSDWDQSISNDHLDATVRDILQHHPNTGYKMMTGHLRARGIHLQRCRIRDSMHRVDPQGIQVRSLQLRTVRRRRYSVPAPNSLWHIDGNHKLIRWRIVVHGGIDGFSRLIVYLTAATNNRASTVMRSFLEAVTSFGVPSRVRSDKGMENIEVARYMVTQRGINRNSFITGRSTHNQRIERLWRDVFGGVLDLFYTCFSNLEAEGMLNPDDELLMFALHWTFLPHVSRHLQFFQDGWNHHRLRTESNQSPYQLWLLNPREGNDPLQADREYGIDWDGPYGYHPEGIQIPEIQLQRDLTADELQQLPDPNGRSFSDCLNVYRHTVALLREMLDN